MKKYFFAVCSLFAAMLPATPAAGAEADLTAAGYEKISPNDIPGNMIKMIGDDWTLITAGDSAAQPSMFNTMTASWGGIGVLWSKPVTFIFVRDQRYTYQLLEKSQYYTLTFYDKKYKGILKDIFGTLSGRDHDKVALSKFTPVDTGVGVGYTQADLIICCKKIYGDKMAEENAEASQKKEWYFNGSKDYHKMYVGEIVGVWIKKKKK